MEIDYNKVKELYNRKKKNHTSNMCGGLEKKCNEELEGMLGMVYTQLMAFGSDKNYYCKEYCKMLDKEFKKIDSILLDRGHTPDLERFSNNIKTGRITIESV